MSVDLETTARVATILGWVVGAVGVTVSVRSFWSNVRTAKAKFVTDLTESFLEKELHGFWYRLDYSKHPKGWRFNLANFRMSDDERLLDTLLYKFAVVGHMLKTNAIAAADIEVLIPMCRQTFENEEVRKYLRFYALDFYCEVKMKRTPFPDALYCYEELTKYAVENSILPKSTLGSGPALVSELRAIHNDAMLRAKIATSLGYACECVRKNLNSCTASI